MEFQSFLLIFIRVASILFTIPFFGSKNVPRGFKIGLAFFMSMVLIHLVRFDSALPADLLSLVVAIAGEFLTGFILGLIARFIFTAVEMAGELIGFKMGFAIVNVIDPQTDRQVPIIGQFKTILCTLIFLSINAHHYFLEAIAESFILLPPLHFALSGMLVSGIMRLAGEMFILAVKIGAPVIVALLITNIAMGIMSKTIPQMNTMIVGFPLTIAGGILVMSLSLPFFAYLIQKTFEGMRGNMLEVISVIGR